MVVIIGFVMEDELPGFPLNCEVGAGGDDKTELPPAPTVIV
jgi:hypothetical protein